MVFLHDGMHAAPAGFGEGQHGRTFHAGQYFFDVLNAVVRGIEQDVLVVFRFPDGTNAEEQFIEQLPLGEVQVLVGHHDGF